jgi:hypothetical protein
MTKTKTASPAAVPKAPQVAWSLELPPTFNISRPSFSRLVAAIENLKPEGGEPRCKTVSGTLKDIDEDGIGEWLVLNGKLPNGRLKSCIQTVCLAPGLYFVEAIINYYEDRVTHDYVKAGRKEERGAAIHLSGKGTFRTFENEQLSTMETISIFQKFFENQTLHPDFQWRDIGVEATAFDAKAKRKKR